MRRRRPARVALVAATAAVTLVIAGLVAGATSASAAVEQLVNGSFDAGVSPWWTTSNLTPSIVDGQLCVDVPAGTTNAWDVIIGQDNVNLTAGESYALSFEASASTPWVIHANVQLGVSPYTQELGATPTISAATSTYTYSFTSNDTFAGGQVAFQLGGSPTAFTFCLDNVSLQGGVAPPVYTPDTGPRVRVNQVGYLPAGPKGATLVTDVTSALPWQLKDAAGTVVRTGTTTPRGLDPSSGQNVQTIDFGSYTRPGTGYTLTADGETSYPFAISGTAYEQLRKDSDLFFYTQRSGIAKT